MTTGRFERHEKRVICKDNSEYSAVFVNVPENQPFAQTEKAKRYFSMGKVPLFEV